MSLLARTPAITPVELAAQFAWFKEDLGGYLTRHIGPEEQGVLNVTEKSIADLVPAGDEAVRPKTLPDLMRRCDELTGTYQATTRLLNANELSFGQHGDICDPILSERMQVYRLAGSVTARNM